VELHVWIGKLRPDLDREEHRTMSDGWTKEQTEEFIENSRHAIEHLFYALGDYNNVLHSNQKLSGLFSYRDQWSPNANHYYAQYLNKKQQEAKVESMSCLAGALLQIAKQALSLRHSDKPEISGARNIGSQSITDVIWYGRNHAMHWDEGGPRTKVKDMLNALSIDIGISIDLGKNNSLVILDALCWKSSDDMIADLKELIK